MNIFPFWNKLNLNWYNQITAGSACRICSRYMELKWLLT